MTLKDGRLAKKSRGTDAKKSTRLDNGSAGSSQQAAELKNGDQLKGGRRMRFSNLKAEAVDYSPMPNIEGLNRQIVEMLQEDGRAAYSSIAKKLNVSEATVRARVGRMRKSNLIHFITVANPMALGYTAWAMLGINVSQNASADDVAQMFRDCHEVVYVMRVASRFDLLAEIVCETPDDLRDFLDTHCYGDPRVAAVEPMVGLGLYKSLFGWEQPLLAGKE
ncbi:MAG: AsnC family transcriptional regulator [Rhodospirillales bacterium]|jgi:Lrp/AsnC family transcriptional regulator, regulator for asnA, asnC and gidA|nr:AsnC family transcriptional regulator [Rhodospirillales bacterium]MBT4039806.1 AsnC family transcriptional regulator [Rhodospirillales bacterium]MBT4627476.1 AsnC family transcriptional regulator [Rhodospirillales bacterium]MBT5350811.1 AsnC family transcriptional regulator [Rhodospirillales bacterium]MBT5519751.1 AsnC family transcriptional regulator [Rhodospirillales bacterium]